MSRENKIYIGAADIKNKIYDEYNANNTELNSLFFDFQVKAPEKVLLETYAEIVQDINGDLVVRLENPELKENGIICGVENDLISNGEYENIYEGNYKDFLESFNERECFTELYRITDIEEKDNLVTGAKLDFIW